MSSSDAGATGQRVLLVYYSDAQQSFKVAEAMADVLRERGCNVRLARIVDGFALRGAVLAISVAASLAQHSLDGASAGTRGDRGDQDPGRCERRSITTSSSPARLRGG
jgi:hypothetical protein